MDIPNELPIIYSTDILIPGYMLKIKLQVENNVNLLKYLNEVLENPKSTRMIGIIPKIDFGRVDNVIGTVGMVPTLIQTDLASKEFFIVVQGICRFILDATVSEGPLKINKIIVIPNFKVLLGDEKENNKLKAEFEKVLTDLLTYSESSISNPFTGSIKQTLKEMSLYQVIDYCLKNILCLTPVEVYKVLRATSLDDLVKLVIVWLRQETIKVNTKYSKTGLFPIPTVRPDNVKYILMKPLLPELKEMHTAIKNSNMSLPVYDLVMKEFKKLQYLNTNHPEYSISYNYLNFVVNLPWAKSTEEKLNFNEAKNMLELSHFGMDKVKKRILQFIAINLKTPERRGPILCFIGPPGVGKTSIANAIANSLNRKFNRISLGGINHYSDIKGHRRSFIGAMPGRIIEAIKQSQTNNPIILLDEIDKMCNGLNGDPAAALLEVLDPEQNSSFVDSYVNIPFDLSRVIFISTANNVCNIPPTLRDRMEIIYLEGYELEEKIKIAENYLIPKISNENKMNEVQITKNTIHELIKKYTHEAGVRDLKHKLQEIYQFVAVKMMENADKEIKNYLITPESLLDIFGVAVYGKNNTLVEKSCDRVGVAIGLSWTSYGGEIQVIETSKLYSKNEKNRLFLTGLVGKTLEESVIIAFNWFKLFAQKNKLDIDDFCVHVHLPEGGYRKDGPSAGITIACALVSLFWNLPLKPMIAMTGEISLNGDILPVGGLKEKILAAFNSNIKTVIIPENNFDDTKSLPLHVVEELNIIAVKHLEDALEIVIPGGLTFLQNQSWTWIYVWSKF